MGAIIEPLSEVFELLPLCPEVEIGLGVPREPIKLINTVRGVRCVGTEDRDVDVTDQLANRANQVHLEHPRLSGYVFKARSPSCGLHGVSVWQGEQANPVGTGIYARRLLANQPDMPVIEEEPLADPQLRAQFIRQVREYHLSQVRSIR